MCTYDYGFNHGLPMSGLSVSWILVDKDINDYHDPAAQQLLHQEDGMQHYGSL